MCVDVRLNMTRPTRRPQLQVVQGAACDRLVHVKSVTKCRVISEWECGRREGGCDGAHKTVDVTVRVKRTVRWAAPAAAGSRQET